MNCEKPFAIGEWKLLGPAQHVSAFEQRINKNLKLWYFFVTRLVIERDTNRFPRENLERVLEFSFPSPSEASMSQYEIECAICYTLLSLLRGE